MTDNLGLNNRVYQILSQNSQKAAVDILGMRISTKYKNKFTEIMITETEAFGTAKADEMSLANQLNRKIPISLPLGPPHVMVLKTYGSNNSLYFLTSKEGSCQAVLIRSGKVILGKNYVETRRKQKMKNDNIYGPGNITKALGIDIEHDGETLLDGSIALAPVRHRVGSAIEKQRKNSKPRDKHLWRFTLVL